MNSGNCKKGAIGVVIFCTAVGALKGLIIGFRRTNRRREAKDFVEDGGPVISQNDDFLTLMGSTGVIITGSTLTGSLQGFAVGILSPLVIPCGVYHYGSNCTFRPKEVLSIEEIDEVKNVEEVDDNIEITKIIQED